MKTIRKPQQRIFQYTNIQNQNKHSEYPGPGSYDISLPLIQPAYEAIRKSSDTYILKVNQLSDGPSFRSGINRFEDPKQKSPGPGAYNHDSKNSKYDKSLIEKKHSQRYSDLIDFMHRDRSKIEPIPDYKIQYSAEQKLKLLDRKNSLKKHRQGKKSQSQQKISKSRISTQNILSIKSSRGLVDEQKNQNHPQRNTIDYPQQSKNFKESKKKLQNQEKMLVHRQTFFNRNMLGMMLAQGNKHKSNKFQVQ